MERIAQMACCSVISVVHLLLHPRGSDQIFPDLKTDPSFHLGSFHGPGSVLQQREHLGLFTRPKMIIMNGL